MVYIRTVRLSGEGERKSCSKSPNLICNVELGIGHAGAAADWVLRIQN